jgi:murein DD-endopeptidase MepM/ murein hydrolase activator NlpD
VTKPVKTQRAYSDVDIETSLWNDMQSAGASPLLILDLANIYAWTVDFFSLQEGDRFRVYYSRTVCEDEVISVDTVFYAVCSHNGKDYTAIRFDQGDKGNVYWNEEGQSLKKAFLKAPLKFSRISSRFSYARKHPVTGKVRPHTGVDYAAPKGTPVMTVGDGRVLSAGWGTGGGNTVRIRHNSTYTSAYLHLSRYGKGIRSGARVHQGQVIGYVGSTGMSTGPHLDFRIWKNGKPVNPVGLISPPAAPLGKANRAAFDSVSVSYRSVVDSLAKAIRKASKGR